MAVFSFFRGVAQLGLERLVWVQEAAGSNPVTPTFSNKSQSLSRFRPSHVKNFALIFLDSYRQKSV
jgi:hypothetical protein